MRMQCFPFLQFCRLYISVNETGDCMSEIQNLARVSNFICHLHIQSSYRVQLSVQWVPSSLCHASGKNVEIMTHHHQLHSLRICKLLLSPPRFSNHVSLCLQSFIYVCIKLLKGYLDKTRFPESYEGSHYLCNFDFKTDESSWNRKFHISEYFKINTVQV